ncbi:BTB/POZ domain-containing protein 17 [Myotis davidii]|uniref:BTB/POZ domain-containing protein 17 n=1 Tax=Myotis davidii TaxID=225400 RepID=L5MH60_MYODS|nr:BTB/POZ domain-containing protein 17 [Myotis davidii]
MLRLGRTKRGPWGTFWAILTLVGLATRAAQRADVGGEAAGTSINHSQGLLQRLQELLRQGNASDVVLRVQAAGTDEVRVFHAHRLLLGLHSQRFRELLSNQSEVLLQEPGECAAVFDKFIRLPHSRSPGGPGPFGPSPGCHWEEDATTSCIPPPSALFPANAA